MHSTSQPLDVASLNVINPGTFTDPTPAERLALVFLDVRPDPDLVLEGVATDRTTPANKLNYGPDYRMIALGDDGVSVTCEFDDGLVAYKLQPGQAYSVEVHRCVETNLVQRSLPLDRRSEDALVFYSLAKKVRASANPIGGDRPWPATTSVWTDGFAVNTVGDELVLGEAYRVTLLRVAGPAE